MDAALCKIIQIKLKFVESRAFDASCAGQRTCTLKISFKPVILKVVPKDTVGHGRPQWVCEVWSND
ncbi:hypothetical protein RR46_10136 [Papilio xuthus]|uniref:Uncharacterized protein n=1 Tax=Papilio xuthus TaxID=66420 RepID=A0A194Q0I8_PAPXU|nr:hypothetical protein RR46_10136 [Papilio xuthus]